jgi:putative oxidoreductase
MLSLEVNRMVGSSILRSKRSSFIEQMGRAIQALDCVPYALLAVPLRLAVATVFWNSAMAKLANWETTLSLFSEEYNVPLLPPELAAYLATSIELTTPLLLVLGFLTRPTALILLGMVAVIEIFVYPLAWPTHLQWAAMLLVLLCRGAGALSLDHLLWRRFGHFVEQASATEAPAKPTSR